MPKRIQEFNVELYVALQVSYLVNFLKDLDRKDIIAMLYRCMLATGYNEDLAVMATADYLYEQAKRRKVCDLGNSAMKRLILLHLRVSYLNELKTPDVVGYTQRRG